MCMSGRTNFKELINGELHAGSILDGDMTYQALTCINSQNLFLSFEFPSDAQRTPGHVHPAIRCHFLLSIALDEQQEGPHRFFDVDQVV